MTYSIENYKTLASRFNSNSFLKKLLLIKQNPSLFSLECDGFNLRLRLLDDEAMYLGLDSHFYFPEFVDFEVISSIGKLADLNIKELK